MALTQSNPASNVPNWYSELFEKAIIHHFQQNGTKLREICMVKTGVVGSAVHFNLLEAAPDPKDKQRHGPVPIVEPTHERQSVILDNKSIACLIAPEDQEKAVSNLQTSYVPWMTNSLNRFIDKEIIKTLDDTTMTNDVVNVNLTTELGSTKVFRDLLEVFGDNEVADMDRYFVIPPKFVSSALGLTQMTSNEYTNLESVQTGKIGYAWGFKWIQSTLLNKTSGTGATSSQRFVDAYAVSKHAVCLAVQKEPSISLEKRVDFQEWQLSGRLALKSKVLLPKGVIRLRLRVA